MPTYPLILPTAPALAKTEITMLRTTPVNQSPFSGKQQVYEWPRSLWQCVATLPPVKRDKAGAWQAFFLQCHGMAGTFLLGDHDARIPRGSARTGVLVNGAGQTGTILNVKGMVNTTLVKGDWIQLGTGSASRLHMVVNDHGGGGPGTTILEIEPALKSSPPDNSAVIVTNTVGLWRMSTPDLGWNSDEASVYGFTFTCHEAF